MEKTPRPEAREGTGSGPREHASRSASGRPGAVADHDGCDAHPPPQRASCPGRVAPGERVGHPRACAPSTIEPAIQYARRRAPELLVWMGIPLLGAFAAGESIPLGRFVVFVVAMTAAMAHLLLVNDWGGLRRNPLEVKRYRHVADGTALADTLRNGAALTLAAGLACGLYLLPLRMLLVMAGLGIGISVLYSHPAIHLKEHVIGSKMLHVTGGTVQFLGGYLVFSGHLSRGVAIGLAFGWIIMAGHFFHECIDAESDRAHDVHTWATRWGVRHCARVGLLMFVCAHAYLLILTELTVLSWADAWVFSVPVAAHACFAGRILRDQDDLARTLRRYRLSYRTMYALSSAAFVWVRLASLAQA
ncbi:MAG TPA: UbiA family prenyltransferase [Methylomirabilota bacterium]|jgi:4-hydroxybenzoate polyprenyltransferase|nr:UbiA family prenyltransferase [Methylomirabilota bacterium]